MLICILTKNVITSCSVTMMLFLHLRSEERFSRNAETDIVCRLLLEKKNHVSLSEWRGRGSVVHSRVPSAACRDAWLRCPSGAFWQVLAGHRDRSHVRTARWRCNSSP